jgi:hypothetical protein
MRRWKTLLQIFFSSSSRILTLAFLPLEENMKRTILFLSLTLLVMSGCHHKFGQATGSGTMKVEKRTVPSFNAVSISGAYDVEIVVQKEQSLEIEGDDNLLPLITTDVHGGTLDIDNTKSFSTKNKLRLRISVPSLNAVSTTGASDIVISGVKSDEFNIDVSGAGSLQLSGETKTLEIKQSGAGDVDAKELHAEKVNVESSGAASADVYASEELRASVSGAGNVNYYGDPKTVNKDASGAGSITKR